MSTCPAAKVTIWFCCMPPERAIRSYLLQHLTISVLHDNGLRLVRQGILPFDLMLAAAHIPVISSSLLDAGVEMDISSRPIAIVATGFRAFATAPESAFNPTAPVDRSLLAFVPPVRLLRIFLVGGTISNGKHALSRVSATTMVHERAVVTSFESLGGFPKAPRRHSEH